MPLTEIEHLLVVLGEEASELAQACSKALRFGLEDEFRGPSDTPLRDIIQEYNDVLATARELRLRGVPITRSEALEEAKHRKLEKMMAYARHRGTLA